jgi:hypothetical protein
MRQMQLWPHRKDKDSPLRFTNSQPQRHARLFVPRYPMICTVTIFAAAVSKDRSGQSWQRYFHL